MVGLMVAFMVAFMSQAGEMYGPFVVVKGKSSTLFRS